MFVSFILHILHIKHIRPYPKTGASWPWPSDDVVDISHIDI